MANPNWKPGVSGNPSGRHSGNQPFIDRAKYLLDQHTIASIREFIGDEKRFNKLSVFDAMIMRRIAEAVSLEGRQSMDSLLDRLLGKPPQSVQIDQTLNAKVEYSAKEEEDKLSREITEIMAIAATKTSPTIN